MSKSILYLMMFFCVINVDAQVIVDDYNRTVEVPDKVTKIYAASPPLVMSVIAFNPELLAALTSPMSEEELAYVPSLRNKEVVGGFFGQGNTPNYEVLAKLKPDVIIMWGGMSRVDNALSKLKSLGIPVLLVRNSKIDDLITQFQLYAKLTSDTKRAEELVKYTKETLNYIYSLDTYLKKNKSVNYYFAEGINGLHTECGGSFHLEPFLYARAENAIDCKMLTNYGMQKISLEKIMLSNPQNIIVMEKRFFEKIKKDVRWKNLKAVQDDRVFFVPNKPFNYITRPPSFMRLLGIRWLISVFYPEVIPSIEKEKVLFENMFFPAKV